MAQPSPTQSNAMAALAAFLSGNLPAGWQVVAGYQNRAPEPQSSRFVVMTPIRFERVETNVDTAIDSKFTGSISGTTLSVTAIQIGSVGTGATLFGIGVGSGIVIASQLSGPAGGTGTYLVVPPQNLGSRTLSAGQKVIEMHSKVTVQLDFHSLDTTAGDAAQTISAMLRDEYGVNFFANEIPNYGYVVPLYADDPREVPFVNDSNQYEWRWVLECLLQVNQTISVPQQFADSVAATPVSVTATYP